MSYELINGVFLDAESIILVSKPSKQKASLFKDGVKLEYGEYKGVWGFFIGYLSVGDAGQGGPLTKSDLVYCSWHEMVPHLKAFLVKTISERFGSNTKMLKSLDGQIDELNKKYAKIERFRQGELF